MLIPVRYTFNSAWRTFLKTKTPLIFLFTSYLEDLKQKPTTRSAIPENAGLTGDILVGVVLFEKLGTVRKVCAGGDGGAVMLFV